MLFRAMLALAGLIAAVLFARWFEEGDYYDPYNGRRHCAAAPAAVQGWSQNGRTRQAADAANLEQWLKEHAADVNHLYGAFCLTPLHTAARFGRDDLAELLIARGADVAAVDEPARNTALHIAAQYGSLAVARVLVARGANVNAPNKYGRTPLDEASAPYDNRANGDRMTQLLLSAGAKK